MGWNIRNLFRKTDSQAKICPEQDENKKRPEISEEEAPVVVQEVCDPVEQPEQEVNTQLLEIFGADFFWLDLEKLEIIKEQMRPVSQEMLRAADWETIRFLCVLDDGSIGFPVKDLFPAGWYLSHDGSWLIVRNNKADLRAIPERCSKNLIFLRISQPLNAPLDLSPMKQLRYLHIGAKIRDPGSNMQIHGLEQLHALETLCLDGTFDFSVLDVSTLKALEVLEIRSNERLEMIKGLTSLRDLKELLVWGVTGVRDLDFSGSVNLERLRLGNLPNLRELPALNQFYRLETLILCEIHFIRSIDMTGMKMLKLVRLRKCSSLEHIEGLETLEHLTHFEIGHTAIHEIPDALRGKSLERLDLSGLRLEELPDWLPELGLLFTKNWYSNGICLDGTTVKDVDMSIFEQPREMILQWFEERKKKENLVQLNEIKVVFLGDGEAGKSHTIARLLNDGGRPIDYTDQSTPGIVIKNKDYSMDGRQIRVHYWDFGGQEILHSMHRIFLTERTLYVVLVNARDETQDARARYWLHNVKSFAKDAPVILVLNKIDQNPKAKVNEPELRGKYQNLRAVVSMSALKDDREKFNQEFTRVLLEEIRRTGYPDVKWPIPWTRVKGELENMESNYIRGDSYREICRKCSVDRNEKALLHWFNDLGVSYCYCDDHKLEDYMILKPDWITNALYIILFNHCPGARNGLIPHASIHALLREDPDAAEEIRRVLPDVYYTWSEISFVLEVFHKSQLSFNAGNDHEFIPMLCDPASSPLAQTYEADENTLEFRMAFDYLPNNLLHQLMVDRKVELQMDHVWRTGALFAQAETGFSAVVTIDDNTLKILVRHSDGMHRPNTYLAMLKANIDRIWQKMGLKVPQNRLVYKYQGQRAEFGYERLLQMRTRGKTEEYCEELDRDFLIEDILNQAAPDTTGDQKALLGAIIQACQSLQGNRRCWDWNENERNTAVRDSLRARGYLVNDQTLQGVSGTGVSTGELDLDIRIVPSVPWTICEALIVKGYSKKWNEHLDKLLDNYNPYSLPVLYLLTYVDCDQGEFGEIWKKYQTHIREDHPAGFACEPGSVRTDLFSAYDSTRAACCRYRKGHYSPTVYHIFARIGG